MEVKNAVIENCDALILEAEKMYHNTNLTFLQEINGWRNGQGHLFVGVPSGGKSTLMRTLISDYTKNMKADERVFIYLSEESRSDHLTSTAYFGGYDNSENIWITSEMPNKGETQLSLRSDEWFDRFCEYVIKVDPSILFFDNLTTSDMYGDVNETQNRIASKLKSFCKQLDIPFVYFIHTHTSIKAGHTQIIDMNDIHGSRKIVKYVEFQYIMQNFNIDENIYTTIRAVKHRGKNIATRMFILGYDAKTYKYNKFLPMVFKEFKELYTRANKLLGK